MSATISPENLATMVSRVTQTMFGMQFSLQAGTVDVPCDPTPWKAALLPIRGKTPVTVAVASNLAGATHLSSAMFCCPPDALEDGMIDDSLAELANIIGGQVKAAMGLDQALGLPRVIQDLALVHAGPWHGARLFSQMKEVIVWVAICVESAQ